MKRVKNILPHWTETVIRIQVKWELVLISTEDVFDSAISSRMAVFCRKSGWEIVTAQDIYYGS